MEHPRWLEKHLGKSLSQTLLRCRYCITQAKLVIIFEQNQRTCQIIAIKWNIEKFNARITISGSAYRYHHRTSQSQPRVKIMAWNFRIFGIWTRPLKWRLIAFQQHPQPPLYGSMAFVDKHSHVQGKNLIYCEKIIKITRTWRAPQWI